MKNEYTITKKLMMSWAKEFHLHGASSIIMFIITCVLFFCGTLVLVLSIALSMDWIYYYFAFLFLFLSVFRLFFSRYVIWTKRYKMFSRIFGVREWIRAIEFKDDEIVVTEHNSVTVLKYENIQKIKEKGNNIMIFFNDNIAVRMYKDAFTEGTWEDCKKKIESMR